MVYTQRDKNIDVKQSKDRVVLQTGYVGGVKKTAVAYIQGRHILQHLYETNLEYLCATMTTYVTTISLVAVLSIVLVIHFDTWHSPSCFLSVPMTVSLLLKPSAEIVPAFYYFYNLSKSER